MTSRERVLAALKGEPVDRLPLMPITMMFAAEHCGVRYGDYARDHRVLAETQVRVANDFGFDQVSVISDPGREAADCGATVRFFDDQPPAVDEENALLSDKELFSKLTIPDPLAGGRMTDRINGVRLLREKVGNEKAVEGWIEGPIAEASDLRGINRVMMDFYEDPDFVRDLFEFVVAMEIEFAREQIEAGADLIGIGDAAASLVGPAFYQEFIHPAEQKLVDAVHEMGGLVRLHICGNTNHHFGGMGALGCELVDLDWMADMGNARREMGPGQTLLGNIDPVRVLRDGTTDDVLAGIQRCYDAAGLRYIVGAGCEVPRGTPPENVHALRLFAETTGSRS